MDGIRTVTLLLSIAFCTLPLSAEPPPDVADWAGRPLVVFLGNLLADRGLTQAIEAIDLARRSIPDIGLMIIGDGKEYARLAAQVDASGLGRHVRLLGWKGHTEHASYYQLASIGILPFLATEHINITLANKLFDYMASGLAVVASDEADLVEKLDKAVALLAKAEEALDGRVAVGAILPFAFGAPSELSRFGCVGKRLAGTDQSFDVDTVVDGLF